ncbi:MAG: hypothetical protein KDD64_12750 [Bdellovibrionales bacterium]|nr:hypothetical protein [Bdellovibrionales bacterium]
MIAFAHDPVFTLSNSEVSPWKAGKILETTDASRVAENIVHAFGGKATQAGCSLAYHLSLDPKLSHSRDIQDLFDTALAIGEHPALQLIAATEISCRLEPDQAELALPWESDVRHLIAHGDFFDRHIAATLAQVGSPKLILSLFHSLLFAPTHDPQQETLLGISLLHHTISLGPFLNLRHRATEAVAERIRQGGPEDPCSQLLFLYLNGELKTPPRPFEVAAKQIRLLADTQAEEFESLSDTACHILERPSSALSLSEDLITIYGSNAVQGASLLLQEWGQHLSPANSANCESLLFDAFIPPLRRATLSLRPEPNRDVGYALGLLLSDSPLIRAIALTSLLTTSRKRVEGPLTELLYSKSVPDYDSGTLGYLFGSVENTDGKHALPFSKVGDPAVFQRCRLLAKTRSDASDVMQETLRRGTLPWLPFQS